MELPTRPALGIVLVRGFPVLGMLKTVERCQGFWRCPEGDESSPFEAQGWVGMLIDPNVSGAVQIAPDPLFGTIARCPNWGIIPPLSQMWEHPTFEPSHLGHPKPAATFPFWKAKNPAGVDGVRERAGHGVPTWDQYSPLGRLRHGRGFNGTGHSRTFSSDVSDIEKNERPVGRPRPGWGSDVSDVSDIRFLFSKEERKEKRGAGAHATPRSRTGVEPGKKKGFPVEGEAL